MKVFTAASGARRGVITPETTFPDQPRPGGRRLRRRRLHDPRARPRRHPAGPVGAVRGAPGVEQHLLRPRRPRARRRASSSTTPDASASASRWRSGPPGRALGVAPSYVTAPVDGDCGPFADDVELASASFGQGRPGDAGADGDGRRRDRRRRRHAPAVRRRATSGPMPTDGAHERLRAPDVRLGRRDARRRAAEAARPDARRDGRRGERRARTRSSPARATSRLYGISNAWRRERPAPRSSAASRRRTRGSSASRRPRTAPRPRSRSRCSSRAAAPAADRAAPIAGQVMAEYPPR